MRKETIGTADLYLADCEAVMASMADDSVDAIVTDPPYGLKFMGKRWDHGVPKVAVWVEALRVLKPGGHLLSFGGSRTYHRMAVAIEDAGFEIRDQIMWIYGSGYPKNQNVSKAIDKAAGAERSGTGEIVRAGCRAARGGEELVGSISIEDAKWKEITAPATEAAKQWDGWGTALKPSHEPIVVARKPFNGTVAANVLEHGTGAINVDACRIPLNGDYKCGANGRPSQTGLGDNYDPAAANQHSNAGRWPANVIHDGSEDVLDLFSKAGDCGAQGKVTVRNADKLRNAYGTFEGSTEDAPFYGDSGSAARFFYCAKASKEDRGDGNTHPTVKPENLMRYLCRLVTPPDGIVLDPYMGSGSTGKAALAEGFRFIGCEDDEESFEIAVRRIQKANDRWAMPLFG